MAGKVRIGISGWRYEPWRGVYYPKGLAQHRELWYSSRQLPTIEINGTFYSLQRPECFQSWYEDTPDDFVFAVKGSRFITHMKKLANLGDGLNKFFARVEPMRRRVGAILWQLLQLLLRHLQQPYHPGWYQLYWQLLLADLEDHILIPA